MTSGSIEGIGSGPIVSSDPVHQGARQLPTRRPGAIYLFSGRTRAVLLVTIIAGLIGIFTGIGLGTGWRAFTVHGGSMEPEFYDGDLIITSHPAGQQVLPGQIIVFTADWASPQYEQRVVHRVAAVGTIDGVPFAYTRGDANEIDDPQPVNLTAKDVHLVRFSISSGAIWLERLTSPYAIGALAALAGAAFMAATAVLVRRKSGIRPLRRLVSGRAS